ncbi:MAG: ABC transporter permease, partial [Gaiellaceae bacterium]
MNAVAQPTIPPLGFKGRVTQLHTIRSEWTKLHSLRSTRWSILVAIVLTIGLPAIFAAVTSSHWGHMSPHDRADRHPLDFALGGVNLSQLAIGVLGVLVMSAEYGTGTIRATFAAAPRRSQVLLAKIAVFGAVSLVVSEVTAFASFFVGQAMLTAPASHATLATPGALRDVVGTGLYLCVISLFALGLATILRHTAGGISAYVGILLVLPIIVQALPISIQNELVRFLPLEIGGDL